MLYSLRKRRGGYWERWISLSFIIWRVEAGWMMTLLFPRRRKNGNVMAKTLFTPTIRQGYTPIVGPTRTKEQVGYQQLQATSQAKRGHPIFFHPKQQGHWQWPQAEKINRSYNHFLYNIYNNYIFNLYLYRVYVLLFNISLIILYFLDLTIKLLYKA